jgi:hypothetical protein
MIIYLDMDDVVADWHGAAQQFLKLKWEKTGERIPDNEWNKIKNNSRFYRDLPLLADAEKLVEWCLDAKKLCLVKDVRFLSAIPRNNDMPWAIQDKVWWANKHFPNIPVFLGPYSYDKWQHCQPGDILIDDRTENCEEWQRVGGHAHIYKNWLACEVWLEKQLGLRRAGINYDAVDEFVEKHLQTRISVDEFEKLSQSSK